MRPSGRALDQARACSITIDVNRHAEGSCLIHCGDTHVLCTASVEDRVPGWLKGQGLGWITAEYGMLPRSTHTRTEREARAGQQSGRTQEIQRLLGRALRAAIDRRALGEIAIRLDCDVIQADGGTRTASITGAYVALALACRHLQAIRAVTRDLLVDQVAAISAGVWRDQAVLDLDYAEDSAAELDGNFVWTRSGRLVEVQATAEGRGMTPARFQTMLDLSQQGCAALFAAQDAALALPTGDPS